MFSGHFKSYFDVKKWLYLILGGVYFFPINAIILFIKNTQKHKRWDLLHEPIKAEHKSYLISRRRHCLLSRDFLPFILNYPNQTRRTLQGVG